MINLTKEQIVETLQRLKDYSHWMYYDERAINLFSQKKVQFEGHEFFLKIEDDGKIRMVLENNVACLYDVRAVTTNKLQNSLDNIRIEAKPIYYSDKNSEYLDYFNKASVFVCSVFQRAIVFTFFCRIADETIDSISNDLLKCNNE